MSCLFSQEGKYTKRALTNSPGRETCRSVLLHHSTVSSGLNRLWLLYGLRIIFRAVFSRRTANHSGQHFINICVDLCLKILANLRLQHAVHFFRIKCLFDKLFSNRAFNLWHEYSPFAGILPRYQSGVGSFGDDGACAVLLSFSAAASSILRRI